MTESERRQLGRMQPYPVYFLQRREEGNWLDIGADAFIPEPEGMAISLVQPGTYRAVIALSPFHCPYTDSQTFESDDRELTIPVSLGQATRAPKRSIVLRDLNGPLAHWPARVLGDHSSLPPLLLESDSAGRLELGRTNAKNIIITIGEEEFLLTNEAFHQQVAVLQIDPPP